MAETAFRAVTIDVEGDATEVLWDDDYTTTQQDTLGLLQQAVGGLVDVVRLDETLDMWVNDNGIAEGDGINEVATYIAACYGLTHQPYFGTAVFTGGADDEGETQPLTADTAARLLRVAHLYTTHQH